MLSFNLLLETTQLCKPARVCNGLETSNIFSEKKEAWKPMYNCLSVSKVNLGCTRIKSSIGSFLAVNTHCRLCDSHCGNQYRRGHKDQPSHLSLWLVAYNCQDFLTEPQGALMNMKFWSHKQFASVTNAVGPNMKHLYFHVSRRQNNWTKSEHDSRMHSDKFQR